MTSVVLSVRYKIDRFRKNFVCGQKNLNKFQRPFFLYSFGREKFSGGSFKNNIEKFQIFFLCWFYFCVLLLSGQAINFIFLATFSKKTHLRSRRSLKDLCSRYNFLTFDFVFPLIC